MLVMSVVFAGNSAFSQQDSLHGKKEADSLLTGYGNSFPVRKNLATVYLYNGTVIKGRIETIYDEVLSYRRKKDLKIVPSPPVKFIAIDSIAVVYFRRNSFLKGLGVGALAGFVGGYIA